MLVEDVETIPRASPARAGCLLRYANDERTNDRSLLVQENEGPDVPRLESTRVVRLDGARVGSEPDAAKQQHERDGRFRKMSHPSHVYLEPIRVEAPHESVAALSTLRGRIPLTSGRCRTDTSAAGPGRARSCRSRRSRGPRRRRARCTRAP